MTTVTRIMLCMIVRNEAKIIERCLAAALPAIDAATICDTGSDDDTIERIETTLTNAGRPHRIPRHEWQNFGKNRSRSFEEARAHALELGWDLASSYALFLDADMVVRVSEEFDANALDAAGYNVRQRHGSLDYENIRLARLDIDWICVGATHEYWALGEHDGAVEPLASLWIDDVGDGGAKDDKFERDIRLLNEDLEADPDNPRTLFYLAQSHFDLKQFERARELYRRRVQIGGWEEETWHAQYRAAMCLVELGHIAEGFGELLVAWNRRPTRAEPLAQLARHARFNKQHHVAHMAAEQALAVGFPSDDRLFVEVDAYATRVIEEIAVNAYYTDQRARGLAACDALVHRHGVPQAVRRRSTGNLIHYAEPLANVGETRQLRIHQDYWDDSFSSTVGSIQRTANGYISINRFVNYYHELGSAFITRDPEGQYFSRNVALTLDRDLNISNVQRINDRVYEHAAIVPTSEAQVCGMEDVRLFRWRNQWWFTANSRQFSDKNFYRVLLGRYSSNCERVESVIALDYDGMYIEEKNWMPLVHNDELYLLYLSQPTIVLQPDLETGQCTVVSDKVARADLSSYRGSTPFIPFNGRLLAIVHDVAESDNHRREYFHRFIILDPDTWMITHVSHPFTFLHAGVEYCCGITWAHNGTDLVVSFSFEERESWLATVDRERVREMLRPVESMPVLRPLSGLGSSGATLDEPPAPPAKPRRLRWWAPQRLLSSERD